MIQEDEVLINNISRAFILILLVLKGFQVIN